MMIVVSEREVEEERKRGREEERKRAEKEVQERSCLGFPKRVSARVE